MNDISLRDYIAVQVLNGWIASGYEAGDETLRSAYEAADAMMLIRAEQTWQIGEPVKVMFEDEK